jgi:hypothetical protein
MDNIFQKDAELEFVTAVLHRLPQCILVSMIFTERADVMPPGVSVIRHYKLFENLPFPVFSEVKSGSVHLDVRWIDQCTSLPSRP